MQYTYHINLDERGSFEADVRNAFGKTVFEISGNEIFEDGFMKNSTDVVGLAKYLQQIGILQPTDIIKQEMATGGQFDLSYEQNPEYIALKKDYDDVTARIPKGGDRLLEAVAEKKRTQMKRIALGDKYRHYDDGGVVLGKILQAVAGYRPPFAFHKKSMVNNQTAEGKIWGMKYTPNLDVLAKFRNDRAFEQQLIDDFKRHCQQQIGAHPAVYSVTEQTPAIVFTIQTLT